MIDRDQARAALVIPADYASDLEKRVPVRVQVIVNGDNANTASAVVGYAGSIVAEAGAELRGRAPPARRPARWSGSSRASGTTRSCAARSSWCPG